MRKTLNSHVLRVCPEVAGMELMWLVLSFGAFMNS